MRYRINGFMAAVLVIGLVLSAQAEMFMKQKHHTDGFTMMGQTQPAKDTFSSTWFGAGKIRNDQDKGSTILRLDKNILYIIDHTKRTYLEMPLDFGALADKTTKGEMGMKVTITVTGEAKKINNWNCKKYLQKMEIMNMALTSEVWATEDLKMDNDIYNKFLSTSLRQNPAMKVDAEKIMQEMKKIKGVQVLTISSNAVMGQTLKSMVELIEFKEGNAPAGTFDLPAGYKKIQTPGRDTE